MFHHPALHGEKEAFALDELGMGRVLAGRQRHGARRKLVRTCGSSQRFLAHGAVSGRVELDGLLGLEFARHGWLLAASGKFWMKWTKKKKKKKKRNEMPQQLRGCSAPLFQV